MLGPKYSPETSVSDYKKLLKNEQKLKLEDSVNNKKTSKAIFWWAIFLGAG